MASWRDNLLPASFRGVPFYVEGHNTTGGRNGPLHEFPGRDTPYFEDMGRKARTWRIRAYVIGDDYFQKRDALLDALEDEGPGPLVHPYLGRISAVAATEYDLSEVKEEGRMARISITFVEAGENQFPAGVRDRALAVGDAADSAQDAAAIQFEGDFDTEDETAFVVEGSETSTQTFLGNLLATAKQIRANEADAWDNILAINRVINDVGTLVRFPGQLAAQMQERSRALANLLPASLFALRPLLDLAGWGDDSTTYSGVTPSRARLNANALALVRLVRPTFAAEGARTLAALMKADAFDSFDAAVAARTEVVAVLDTEIDAAGDSGAYDLFVGLTDLRTHTLRLVDEEALRLPRLKSWTPAATIPAAVIAWRLYGDAARADEISLRNNIRHPGFVAGGSALQVLES